MNFKESYKKVNDEIKGDRALLENILNTPVKEKTKITLMVYRFASCAAAIILVGAVILMPTLKDKFVTENASEAESAAADGANEDISLAAEITEDKASYSETADDDFVGEAYNEELKKAEFSIGTKSSKEMISEGTDDVEILGIQSEGEPIEEETAVNSTYMLSGDDFSEPLFTDSAATEETYNTATTELLENGTSESTASRGGGSASSASAISGGSAKSTMKSKKTTCREVMEYAGISYESFNMSDMSLTTSDVIKVEYSSEGEISAYEIKLVLEKESAKMIVLMKNSTTPLEFSIVEESGKVTASETLYNADIFVTAYNMSKEEVESYILNIA